MENKAKEKYPLVSVVAVCYNHERFVEETLDSIAAQTYPNIELIIIDDCSSDRSVNVIHSWLKRSSISAKFVAHKENSGLINVLNEALSMVNGKYFKPISCDDLLCENYLSMLVPIIEREGEEFAGICCDAKVINSQSEIIHPSYLKSKGIFSFPKKDRQLEWLIDYQFPAPGMMIRTKCLLEIGGYDPSFEIEDYWLWLRIAENYKWALIDRTMVCYRRHYGTSHVSLSQVLFSNQDKGLIEKNQILFRYLKFPQKVVRVNARRQFLMNVNKIQREVGSCSYGVQVGGLDCAFKLLLLAICFLPGYYYKKQLIFHIYKREK